MHKKLSKVAINQCNENKFDQLVFWQNRLHHLKCIMKNKLNFDISKMAENANLSTYFQKTENKVCIRELIHVAYSKHN